VDMRTIIFFFQAEDGIRDATVTGVQTCALPIWLVNFLYTALDQELAKQFQVVDQDGPDVMKLQVAVTDLAAATPGLRTMTMLIPQARLLSTLKRGATGSYPFVGGAQAEFKVTDSVTGQVLVAGVDRRIGGGNISTAAQWEWGDAENVMKDWAKLAVERLSAWT